MQPKLDSLARFARVTLFIIAADVPTKTCPFPTL